MDAVLIRDILIEAMLSLSLKRKNNLKELVDLVLFLRLPPKRIGQQQENRAATRGIIFHRSIWWKQF
ncbi:hypothetical protein HanOQP8_Chr11g0417971 [Helianthus annuus]|nr:hypothetical protein HanHA89_Chr11g0439211 [Helianthus annuus]KAJ0686636.1 hypothetical protein HanLR1_Chr11g0416951 [Helianthus annuus]KAJ0690452.1 hypothetical protein HanOQP8_Chr11g0417971 [Helianthus annuus]